MAFDILICSSDNNCTSKNHFPISGYVFLFYQDLWSCFRNIHILCFQKIFVMQYWNLPKRHLLYFQRNLEPFLSAILFCFSAVQQFDESDSYANTIVSAIPVLLSDLENCLEQKIFFTFSHVSVLTSTVFKARRVVHAPAERQKHF